jgi:hypothetical protein
MGGGVRRCESQGVAGRSASAWLSGCSEGLALGRLLSSGRLVSAGSARPAVVDTLLFARFACRRSAGATCGMLPPRRERGGIAAREFLSAMDTERRLVVAVVPVSRPGVSVREAGGDAQKIYPSPKGQVFPVKAEVSGDALAAHCTSNLAWDLAYPLLEAGAGSKGSNDTVLTEIDAEARMPRRALTRPGGTGMALNQLGGCRRVAKGIGGVELNC